jgi:hypothetical protein
VVPKRPRVTVKTQRNLREGAVSPHVLRAASILSTEMQMARPGWEKMPENPAPSFNNEMTKAVAGRFAFLYRSIFRSFTANFASS